MMRSRKKQIRRHVVGFTGVDVAARAHAFWRGTWFRRRHGAEPWKRLLPQYEVKGYALWTFSETGFPALVSVVKSPTAKYLDDWPHPACCRESDVAGLGEFFHRVAWEMGWEWAHEGYAPHPPFGINRTCPECQLSPKRRDALGMEGASRTCSLCRWVYP